MTIHMHAAGALLCAGLFGPGGGEGSTAVEDPHSGLLHFNLADNVTMKFFGRLFVDWGWFSGDDATYDLADATEFRAARMGVGGTIYENIGYKAEFDFAGDKDVELKDVYMSLLDTPVGEVRAGHFKEPFSLEELTSSRFITFMERGLSNAFSPGRNSGFAILDSCEEETMTWGAGIFRNTGDAFDAAGSGDAEYGYTGRFTYSPLHDSEAGKVVHLGASASYRTDKEVAFSARPESHLLNSPASTGAIAADDTTLVNGEFAWVNGPLSVQAEYTLASVGAVSGGQDGDFSGYYAFLSWFLTGEHRNYKASHGAFDRVKPMENYGAGSGAIELAARYSFIDLNDGPSVGEMTDYTGGVNWYLNPNTRVMLNYVHSEYEEPGVDDSADLLMLRFQVDW